jgi:DNA-binding transcriptional MerR regulator
MPDLKLNKEESKLFYRIGEVSEMLGVAPSLLRFWEKDFDCLKQINKTRKGDRLYSEKNIRDLKMIHHLVKTKGYTLQGANEYMNKNAMDIGKNQAIYDSMVKIRAFLLDLKDNL